MTEISKPPETVTYSEYKGNNLIVLPNGQPNGFSFGLGKAKLILKYIKEIEEFVNQNTKL